MVIKPRETITIVQDLRSKRRIAIYVGSSRSLFSPSDFASYKASPKVAFHIRARDSGTRYLKIRDTARGK